MNIYRISKSAKFFIYAILLTPLLIIPSTLWEFVFIRNIIFYCFSLILIFLCLFGRGNERDGLKITRGLILIFLFIVIRIVSGIFGIDPHNSFFGSQTRMGGNLSYILLFGWFLALLFFLRSREEWNKFFKISVIIAAGVSVFAVIQAFFPEGFGILEGKAEGVSFWAHRLTGTLGNPIFLSGYLLPHIFLSGYLAAEEKFIKRKFVWAALAIFLAVIVFLTGTRGALVGLAASAFVLTVIGLRYLYRHNKGLFKKCLFASVIAAAILIIIVFVINRWLLNSSINGYIYRTIYSGTALTRFIMWKIGILGFFDKPILGWGAENYSYVFSKFYNPELLKFSFYETWADKPHNQFVEVATETGIIGLTLFLGIFIAFFRDIQKLIKNNQEKFLSYLFFVGALVAYASHIFFAFDTIESRIIIFGLLAYIVFLRTTESQAKNIVALGSGYTKTILMIIVIVAGISMWLIGIKTLRASFYASAATNALADNNYGKSVKYAALLDKIKTPYSNGNWEVFSDIILQKDAGGQIPRSILQALLPIITKNLKVVADKYPENFSYNYRLAQMYHLSGTYISRSYNEKSIEYLEKSKKISPQRQAVSLFLAQVYFSIGEIDKAIGLLEELVKSHENISEPYWYLGILYDAKGEYDKSYAFMSAAFAKGRVPQNINEEALYVTVLGRFKDYAAMAPIYESIIEKNGENPTWWANVATVYLELKQYEKARTAARQAIFLNPKFGDEGERFLRKVDAAENGK